MAPMLRPLAPQFSSAPRVRLDADCVQMSMRSMALSSNLVLHNLRTVVEGSGEGEELA